MNTEHHYQDFLNTNPYPRILKNHSGRSLINFSMNDYLGLAMHPLLIERAQEFIRRFGVGATSSRLIANNPVYEELENKLAKNIGKPAALILGAGFQTNFSVLEALLNSTVLKQQPLVFCDRLCHSSMLVGASYHGNLQRYHHNDLTHLQKLLEKNASTTRPKFILAESLYSMEGDQTDLAGVINLAKQYQTILYIDDAHAVGVCGRQGWGYAAEYANDIDIIMGTFSKALGSFGGYIACSTTMRDYFINKCKGLIYSTALPPGVLGAIDAAIELMPTLQDARAKVLAHGQKLRGFFQQQGLNVGSSSTHIVPWIIGSAEKTLLASQLLEELGILAVTIRPPSVPPGQCRIRFCLSAAHTDAEIEQLMAAIQKVEQKL